MVGYPKSRFSYDTQCSYILATDISNTHLYLLLFVITLLLQFRTEVIMLMTLCIILFRISCNFSALCSNISCIILKIIPKIIVKPIH